jgi:hypothetical protein
VPDPLAPPSLRWLNDLLHVGKLKADAQTNTVDLDDLEDELEL